MSPAFIVDDPPDQLACDSIHGGNVGLLNTASGINRADSLYLLDTKLAFGISLAAKMGPLNNLVSDVRPMRCPAQIIEPVVQFVAVREVTCLHSFGAQADECFEDEAVDVVVDSSQIDPRVFLTAGLQLPPRTICRAPHASIAPHSILGMSSNRTISGGHCSF